jgi:hypothetical protein
MSRRVRYFTGRHLRLQLRFPRRLRRRFQASRNKSLRAKRQRCRLAFPGLQPIRGRVRADLPG